MSKVVDERVVQMEFDNKQFESNVKTTMSTLDKLKQSLNLPGASKGLEEVNRAANNCDLSGLSNGIETVKMKFSALQVMGITALANITNSAVNAGKRILSSVTNSIIQGGKTRAMNLENAHFQLQGLLKDEAAVSAVMKNVNDSVDGTAYSLDSAAKVASQFAASGMKAGDQMFSALRAVAGVAAMTNSEYDDIGRIFTQVAGQGKLMGDQLLQLSGRGMNAAATLATYLHKSEAEVRDMVSKGKIDFATFAAAMDNAFGEHAKKANETLTGAMSNVKAALARIGAEFISPLIVQNGPLVKFFNSLRERINDVKSQIGPFAELFTKSVAAMAEKASDFLSKLKVDNGIKSMHNIVLSLVNVFKILWEVIKPIGQAFKETFSSITGKTIVDLTEKIKNFTDKLKLSSENAERVKRVFKGVFSIFDLGKKALTAFMKPLFDFSQSKGISSLADFLLEAAASIGDFFTSINEGAKTKDILTNISDALSNAFGGASKVFESATNGLRGFGEIFKSVWSWISKVAGKIGTAISTAFKWITENVSVGDIFAGLLGGGIFVTLKKFSGLLDKIKEVISNIFDNKTSEGGIGDKFKSILDKVHDSLESFTSGIKVASLVSIAIAIGILSASLKSIASLKISELSKGLSGIGGLLTMLSWSFKSLTKSLSKYDSKGVVKAGIAMIAMSIAIKILSKALVEIAGLEPADIFKGLVAIGIGLLEFVGILKLLDKTDGSIKSAITMILVAEACKILGDVLASLGSLSWEEIGRGLVAMGGALAEITAVTVILGKYGKGGSLIGAVSMLIMVQSLDEIYEALKNFGSMAWEEIRRGLTAMGVALAELGLVIGLLGKFGGMSSLVGAVSILIVAQTLDEIYEALKNFGTMSWEEIRRGLVAMGGALAEIGIITGLLGKFGGLSSLAGAISILIVAHTLDEIYEALKDFGSMSWGEIGRGLVAMGGALIELAAITGLLGTLAPGTGLLGAVTILIVAQALKPIGEALSDIGQLSWSEIARGLVGMGGALTELAVITGLLGNLGGLGALLGAGTILLAVQGLGDLADALKKFGEMSWDEIGRGLTAMGAALGEVALGSLLNTLSGLGAKSISEVAGPLGTLADSVKKWSDVTIPENLASQLGSLACGIMNFTFGESGAGAIAEVAEPLGILADSVKKWSDVTVPENIGEKMSLLADGVRKFTFSGLGAGGLAEAAEPLGTLADSVSKWANVTVPEGLGDDLTSLANGVKSFSFAFAGGWSISQIIEPLGNLVDAVLKWKDVSIPATLGDDLTSLANGVKSFSFAFAGGWSISSILDPLGNLADTIKKWADVKVPEGIEKNLTNIANGIKQFSLMDAAKISTIDEPLKTLSVAFKNFGNITGTGENLVTFATNIKDCGSKLAAIDTGAIDTASSTINKLISVMEKVNGTNTGNVASFVNAANKLNNIKIDNIKVNTSNLSSAVSSIKKTMESMSKTISSSKSSLDSAMKTAISGLSTAVKSKESAVSSAGKSLVSTLENAIKSKKSSINSACKSLVSGCASAVKEKISSMESAGKDLGAGLVEGIKSKKQAAYDAGYALGQAAVQGEKDGQASNSPSKLTIKAGKWLGEGLVVGIQKTSDRVYQSGYNLGETATDAISSTISRITDVLDSDIDTQPTIRPVLDLSDVSAGAGTINRMFGTNPSVGVLAKVGSISSMMNSQNGSDKEVISAIKDLGRKLDNKSGDTYNFGDFTYDDGSNVSDAVRTLVRAVKIEGRR